MLTIQLSAGTDVKRCALMYLLKGFALLALCWSLSCSVYAKTIIELNTTGKPPLNTPNQQGFMDLVAKEAFRRIGITLKTVQLPAERGLLSADNGLEDGDMSRIAGLEKTYTHLIRVPEKIMDWEFVTFSNRALSLKHGWKDLQSYSVAYINGWKILEQHVSPSANVIKVNTPEQLFTMLRKHRTDLIIYERWGGLEYANQFDLPNIKVGLPPLAIRDMFIYLNQKHQAIVHKLAIALRQLKEDGTYQKLYAKILMPLTRSH